MTTLSHTYRLVSALLYRMQSRSVIAEYAWDEATAEDRAEAALFGQTSVLRMNAARNKAIGLIADGDHFPAERSRAIVAIDEAVRAAIAVDFRELFAGSNVQAFGG